MRKYFWQKDNVSLVTYTEKYKDFIDNEPDEEDICLMILNENEECVGHIVLNWLDERGGSTGIYVEVDENIDVMGMELQQWRLCWSMHLTKEDYIRCRGHQNLTRRESGSFYISLDFLMKQPVRICS